LPQLATRFSIPLPVFESTRKGDCDSEIKWNKHKGKKSIMYYTNYVNTP